MDMQNAGFIEQPKQKKIHGLCNDLDCIVQELKFSA